MRLSLPFSMLSFTLFLATAAIAQDHTPRYSLKTFDVSLPQAKATTVLSINAEGQIVGRYMIGLSVHGFFYDGTALTTIDDPDILPSAPVTYPSGINPSGWVSGYYLDPPLDTDPATLVTSEMGMDFDMSGDPPAATRLRGFLRSPEGSFAPIDFPVSQVPSSYPGDGYIQTMAIHLSANGTVVGCFHHFGGDFPATMHGFVYRDGQYDFFPLVGSMHNSATPDGKTIVGQWRREGQPHFQAPHRSGNRPKPVENL